MQASSPATSRLGRHLPARVSATCCNRMPSRCASRSPSPAHGCALPNDPIQPSPIDRQEGCIESMTSRHADGTAACGATSRCRRRRRLCGRSSFRFRHRLSLRSSLRHYRFLLTALLTLLGLGPRRFPPRLRVQRRRRKLHVPFIPAQMRQRTPCRVIRSHQQRERAFPT
jgi:hypothetical protein